MDISKSSITKSSHIGLACSPLVCLDLVRSGANQSGRGRLALSQLVMQTTTKAKLG